MLVKPIDVPYGFVLLRVHAVHLVLSGADKLCALCCHASSARAENVLAAGDVLLEEGFELGLRFITLSNEFLLTLVLEQLLVLLTINCS